MRDDYEPDLNIISDKKTLCSFTRVILGINDSCFKASEIVTLAQKTNEANAYDKNYKYINIYDAPDKILGRLRKFYKQCKNDVCIVKQVKNISNDEAIPKILELAFKPRGPEGQYEWLSNYDILNLLDYFSSEPFPNFLFVDATPRDFESYSHFRLNTMKKTLTNLYNEGKDIFGFVFNLDTSRQSGSHWVSLVVDLRDKKNKKCSIEYVDSVGKYPLKEFTEYIDKIKHEIINNLNFDVVVRINKTSIQKGGSECGMFSVGYILYRLFGGTFDDYIKNPPSDEEINLYRKEFFRNGALYIHRKFDPIFDPIKLQKYIDYRGNISINETIIDFKKWS